MKCSFCGKELEPGSGFCPNCGTMMSVDEGMPEENGTVISGQKYEPDRNDVYSREVAPEEPSGAEPVDEDISVPEYVPSFGDDDLETKNAKKDIGDPFGALREDDEPHRSSFDDDGDDMYLKQRSGKKGGAAIALLAVALVAVLAVGVNVLRKNGSLPAIGKTTTENVSTTVAAPETEKPTEKTTQDKTGETKETKETKESKETKETEETTEKETKKTEKQETTGTTGVVETTEKKTEAPTTKPASTTAPSTTKAPVVTTVPSTTNAPSTTKVPSTTKAPTSKPSKLYSSPLTKYVSVNGVALRKAASSSASTILYLSVGNDIRVYGEESGFCYIYSPRYGVYGWVPAKYLSNSRPVAESESKVSGVVAPDNKYSAAKSATVATYDGLRLRKGPGTSYDVIRMIGGGYPLRVLGTSSKNPGWVYVNDITHGVSGWVSAEFIKY